MSKTILAVNAGSSSVKLTFYTRDKPPQAIANVQVSGIGSSPSKFEYSRGSDQRKEELKEAPQSPNDAFKILLDRCFGDSAYAVARTEDLAYICHRIVHGGDYEHAVEINPDTLHHLEALEDLAPLHNVPALGIVRACHKQFSEATNIACFDSAFHQTLPDHVRTYPINQDIAKKRGLRKYGFHGISYSFILRSTAEFLKKPVEETNLIALHLGSGASACAIRSGKSIDTSMGLTPLDGLPGSSRSGSIDPSLVFHYTSHADKLSPASTSEMHISAAEEILNKQSGWKALTGTADFSQIATLNPSSPAHKLAFDIFVDRILGFIGSYYLKLEGNVDALVFAGGVGEKSALLRKTLVEKAHVLGFRIDESTNDKGAGSGHVVTDISKDARADHKVLICQTDEQFEMARDCASRQ